MDSVRGFQSFTWTFRLLAVLLLSCGPIIGPKDPEVAGPCTETGNPTSLAGIVRDSVGNPVAGASIKLFRLSSTQGDPVVVAPASTCADGSFRFGALSAAAYALEAVDSSRGTVGWHSRVDVPGVSPSVTLVLKAPGQLRGLVTRGSNAVPAGISKNEKILVRLIDTDRFAYSDIHGNFEVGFVAEGVYRVSFTALDGHYLTRYVDSVRILAGETTELPELELEWSPFVAPPMVSGIAVTGAPDNTLSLQWEPVKVSNFAHYELHRRDTLASGGADTLKTITHSFTDSLPGSTVPRLFEYKVRAVNRLGNKGPWGDPIYAYVPSDSNISAHKSLAALILGDGIPVAAARVKLFRLSEASGSPDLLPLMVEPADSALTGADGTVRFHDLAAGRYSMEALDPATGRMAFRQALSPGTGVVQDTLLLSAPGALKGTVTREKLWITTPFKGDENVQVSLAGTPYVVYSNFDGSYKISGVPAGNYTAVFYALPEGYFAPDSQKAAITSGDTLEFPKVTASFNSNQAPPLPVGLHIVASSRSQVTLRWDPIANYPFLKGYQLIRMDSTLNTLFESPVLEETEFWDSIATLPSGTILKYVVRALNERGNASGNGGDSNGLPVTYLIP